MTEIEVKLSISEEGYKTLITALAMHMTGVLRQMNIFFYTPDNTLRRNARLRKIQTAEMETKWVFTSKGRGSLTNGISTHSEIEAPVAPEIAEKMLKDTENLYQYLPKIIQDAIPETAHSKFKIRCNFLSVRRVIPFEGMIIEADECTLPNHEKFYEIEVESKNPLEAKAKLCKFLDSIHVKYSDSTKSKFGRNSSLPEGQRINLDL